jgi:hypothetical protein
MLLCLQVQHSRNGSPFLMLSVRGVSRLVSRSSILFEACEFLNECSPDSTMMTAEIHQRHRPYGIAKTTEYKCSTSGRTCLVHASRTCAAIPLLIKIVPCFRLNLFGRISLHLLKPFSTMPSNNRSLLGTDAAGVGAPKSHTSSPHRSYPSLGTLQGSLTPPTKWDPGAAWLVQSVDETLTRHKAGSLHPVWRRYPRDATIGVTGPA